MFSSFIESFLPTVYADEQPAQAADAVEAKSDANQVAKEKESEPSQEEQVEEAEEEEEEEEVEDQGEAIREACGQTKVCANFKHHFEECGERLAAGKTIVDGETCVEELFHYMHCVDDCAAPKIFAALK
ncbi:cytochrome b-c1 complex subunit 6 family protein [Sporobolomyces salmoneus]|uniref:cytochrome b-c1 complex subunit 6 family protein n=1 Tax=Sporobolomyces salmoneus TaxID=183962 RepID=UPI003171F7B6